jgi:hypothetical protein
MDVNPDLDGGMPTMNPPFIQRGRMSLYSVEAAKDAVRKLQSRGAAVVGIEGFSVTETTIEPLMDYIAHWPEAPRQPWGRYVELCAAYCLEVLSDWEHDLPSDFMVSLAVDDGSRHDRDRP